MVCRGVCRGAEGEGRGGEGRGDGEWERGGDKACVVKRKMGGDTGAYACKIWRFKVYHISVYRKCMKTGLYHKYHV